MDQKLFTQRLNKLLAYEGRNPLSWWYLSYADEKFNGAVVIQAHGPTEAAYLSNYRKINPGGEILILSIPEDAIPPEEYRNRLLTKEEVMAIWPEGEWKSLAELDAEEEGPCQGSE